MREVNYVEVIKVANARQARKKEANRFIVWKVREFSEQISTTIKLDNPDALDSPWTNIVHGLEPQYYKSF